MGSRTKEGRAFAPEGRSRGRPNAVRTPFALARTRISCYAPDLLDGVWFQRIDGGTSMVWRSCFGARGLVGLVLVALIAQPASAACWEPQEYEAARVRDLQTMLMVSALQCRGTIPEMPAAYNRFVNRARGVLQEGEKALLAHFLREGDKLAYDRFTTALANKYAELGQHPEFCRRAKKVLDADEATNGVLPEVVGLLNSRPNGVNEVCPTKPRSSIILVSPFAPLPEGGQTPVAAASGATGAPGVAAEPALAPAPAPTGPQ
jgi:hypothetical protein